MEINYKNKNINLPDFIIVGAQKSATTSIYKNLINNSNIYMPEIKEINFFAYDNNDILLLITFSSILLEHPCDSNKNRIKKKCFILF